MIYVHNLPFLGLLQKQSAMLLRPLVCGVIRQASLLRLPPITQSLLTPIKLPTVRVSPGDDDHGVFQRFVHPSRKERMAILTRKHCVVWYGALPEFRRSLVSVLVSFIACLNSRSHLISHASLSSQTIAATHIVSHRMPADRVRPRARISFSFYSHIQIFNSPFCLQQKNTVNTKWRSSNLEK
jgi:hypothetical protein